MSHYQLNCVTELPN